MEEEERRGGRRHRIPILISKHPACLDSGRAGGGRGGK